MFLCILERLLEYTLYRLEIETSFRVLLSLSVVALLIAGILALFPSKNRLSSESNPAPQYRNYLGRFKDSLSVFNNCNLKRVSSFF